MQRIDLVAVDHRVTGPLVAAAHHQLVEAFEPAEPVALAEADEKGVRGKDITPFLLARIKEITKGISFASNVQLAYNNARVASRIAVEYCKLP